MALLQNGENFDQTFVKYPFCFSSQGLGLEKTMFNTNSTFKPNIARLALSNEIGIIRHSPHIKIVKIQKEVKMKAYKLGHTVYQMTGFVSNDK